MNDSILDAPCMFCAYNEAGYWQSKTHDKNCPFYNISGGYDRDEMLPHIIKNHFKQIQIMRDGLNKIKNHRDKLRGNSGYETKHTTHHIAVITLQNAGFGEDIE